MNKTRRIAATGALTALIFVVTFAVRIPNPVGGYINFGDAVIFIAAACLGGIPALIAGGIGSCLADLIGYPQYAVFTLIIKGLEGLICGIICGASMRSGKRGLVALIGTLGMLAGAGVMIGLYTLTDYYLYGAGVAIANIAANAIQGGASVCAAAIVVYSVNLPKYAAKYGITPLRRLSDRHSSDKKNENK